MARESVVKFTGNAEEITAKLGDKAWQWLEEASGEIEARTKRNSRVDTGQLKSSWTHAYDKTNYTAYVGSPLQNAIWEEFGTGEYAVGGDGRKTPWKYKDHEGNWHYTTGKRPNRTLQRAVESSEKKIYKRLLKLMKEVGE